MLDQFILKLITPFSQCNQECDAKTIVREKMDDFDDEQKINYAHNLCHMYGVVNLLVKILAVAFIVQTIYFSFFFRMR